ncbi:MAG: hypothetical protein HY611_06915 [Elusimicrobia bacterium]|nr:hypothetical protein [Elusimicrobiota bacterium]
MKKLWIVFALCLTAPSAKAYFQPGLSQSFGKDSYRSTNAYLQFGSRNFSLAPEFSMYSDKTTGGSFKTVSARAGYDTQMFGLGATAGSTLSHNRYSTVFGGVDVAFTLSATGGGMHRMGGAGRSGAPGGKGLARIDFGGGILHIRHKVESGGSSAASELGQTDIYGFAGASILGARLSARLTVPSYSKDPKSSAVPVPSWVPITGHTPGVGTYPENSLHLKAEWPIFPLISPFVSYTRTQYKEIQGGGASGKTGALAAGVSLGLQMLEVNGSIQRVSVNGGSDKNFVSLGAGLRF